MSPLAPPASQRALFTLGALYAPRHSCPTRGACLAQLARRLPARNGTLATSGPQGVANRWLLSPGIGLGNLIEFQFPLYLYLLTS